MNIRRINRRLKKRFGPAVTATLTDGCIVLSGHLPAWAETVEACSLAAEKYSTTHVVNEIRCDEAGEQSIRIPTLRDTALEGRKPDVLIIGGGISGASIARELSKWQLDILLVVDECFLDFVKEPEEYSLKHSLSGFNNLFILKAFTKRYAMAGVRLGYGLCSDRKLMERMELCVQPWNVSTMAQAAGLQALTETEYVEEGRQLVFREAQWLKDELVRIGYKVFPSEANYIFFKGPEELFDFCLRKRILIRDCSNYPGLTKGYYRIAVKRHEENVKLIEVLEGGILWQKQ